MSIRNLLQMYKLVADIDYCEGRMAYLRYNRVMLDLADKFAIPLDQVVAGFVSLSPNNDYTNNLRSLITVLRGINAGVPVEDIKVSTYGHCGKRAYAYVTGQLKFLDDAKGLKIINFYHNILTPSDNRYVTIDGHMNAIWRNQNLTMKEATIKSDREYNEIADAVKMLAFGEFLLPCQLQAMLWFTRKRVFRIKADLQFDWLCPADDVWKTYRDISEIRPF